jgi:hypothetical protein
VAFSSSGVGDLQRPLFRLYFPFFLGELIALRVNILRVVIVVMSRNFVMVFGAD